jgi:hypothetical protein
MIAPSLRTVIERPSRMLDGDVTLTSAGRSSVAAGNS